MAPVAQQQRVARVCGLCAADGVLPGMTLAHARAVLPRARDYGFDPAGDARSLRRLAEWATRWSPIAAPDRAEQPHHPFAPSYDSVLLNITGCERAFRGRERMCRLIAGELRRRRVRSRTGLGGTIGQAWAAAWFGGGEDSGAAQEFHAATASSYPTAALRLEDSTVAALAEVGVDTIGQLLGLPREQLPSRFGHHPILRLDQLLGHAMETIEPVRPAPALRVERAFDGPVTDLEAVELTTRELTEDLCRELRGRGSGVLHLEAVFEGGAALRAIDDPGRGVQSRRAAVTLSAPSRSPRHLWALLRARVQSLRLGFGVESIALVAGRTGRLRHVQATCRKEEAAAAPGVRAELLDVLTGRLGADRVALAARVESHIPERAFRLRRHDATLVETTGPSPSSRLRPPLLLDEPEDATAVALQPDRPPTVLRWRGHERRLTVGIGPERIGEEWWKQGATPRGKPIRRSDVPECLLARDYYRVRDQGGLWLWIYRDLGSGRWFVHGLWA